MPRAGLLNVEYEEDAIILIPTRNLNELEDIQALTEQVDQMLDDEGITNVVMDFAMTDYFGSTALGFFIHLWKRLTKKRGRLVFCNLSDHQQEILEINKMDDRWPICDTREEALKAVVS
jgi:anti-anti-sigma factor